jgi:uncharacterized protein (UPF0216 family)
MLKKEIKMQKLAELLKEKNKHFDFQFTDKEYEYFMANARLKPIEKQVLEMRRKDMTRVAIALELGTCVSNVDKIIRKIKNKIIKCIIFG